LPVTGAIRTAQAWNKAAGPPVETRSYEWAVKPVETPGASGVVKVTKPAAPQNPIAKTAPKRLEEFALNTIPKGLETFGKGLTTDQLLAWEALRRGNPNIDKMPEADRARLINRAVKSKGFSEWKTKLLAQ